jgi:hypothetical protein
MPFQEPTLFLFFLDRPEAVRAGEQVSYQPEAPLLRAGHTRQKFLIFRRSVDTMRSTYSTEFPAAASIADIP